jgi:hypothetical protein
MHAMKGASVAVQAVRDVLYFAESRGVDAARLARDAGVDPRKLEDNNARLAGSTLGRLWELAAERTADPFFGLRLGAMATPGGLGILGYTMLSSRTLGAALDHLVRYGHLYTFGIDFDVLRSGDILRIECRVVGHVDNYLLASPRHPLECTMAAIRAVSGSLVGRPVPVRSVKLGHVDPGLGRDGDEEGTTYQELLEQTRRGLAMRYLADPRAVIFEVAILLGFSEPSAFHRAFKRWTGYTPRQFQRLSRDGVPV